MRHGHGERGVSSSPPSTCPGVIPSLILGVVAAIFLVTTVHGAHPPSNGRNP